MAFFAPPFSGCLTTFGCTRVIDLVDFNSTTAGQRILDENNLASLVEVLNRHRLGLDDVESDILGRAYEYLIRKFAEGSGQSAGEFFTPPEVAELMAYILDPEEGETESETIYDPTCGSGGLLIKAQLRLRDKIAQRLGNNPRDLKLEDIARPLQLFGQEIGHTNYAMARMNAFVHDMQAQIVIGDTMKTPKFTASDTSLQHFHKVTANPMWNQKFTSEMYENDTYQRFTWGVPPQAPQIGDGCST
jgi:type I restriction enzyme M protein